MWKQKSATKQPSKGRARNQRRLVSPDQRRELFHTVTGKFPIEFFLPEEAVALLFGRMETVKRTLRDTKHRWLINRTGNYALSPLWSQKEKTLAPPQRPGHILSRLNRSSAVFPPLVPSIVDQGHLSIARIVELSRKLSQAGVPPHQLVDLLAVRSGLSTPACADLLVAHKVIAPIADEDIIATSLARAFWNMYAQGRAHYQVLVIEKEAPDYPGDWAYFNRQQLQALLPGSILADHFQRREYLTNYVDLVDGSCLDLYSMSLPLVQHPFLSKFNPLIFGKPQPSRIKGMLFIG